MHSGADLTLGANLLLTFEEMGSHLCDLLQRPLTGDNAVDAFLLAAGMHQMAEDAASGPSFPGFPRRGGDRGVAGALGEMVGELAATVAALIMGGDAVAGGRIADGRGRGRLVAGIVGRSPSRLRREVVRLPNCYRSFDQHPSDSLELVRRLAQRWPDRRRPVTVVGLRTSGSYLGPLAAAFLGQLGYSDVEVVTVRPGRRPRPELSACLRRRASPPGLAVVVDDPPVTGAALGRAAADLQGLGWQQKAIVVMVAVFADDGALPPSLNLYHSVTLPWEEWAVPSRLADDCVLRTASALAGVTWPPEGEGPPLVVEAVEKAEVVAGTRPRGHARGALRLAVRDAVTGGVVGRTVGVEGAGVGYLGRHAAYVSDRLSGWAPAVLVVDDGVLFRQWMPEDARLGPDELVAGQGEVAGQVAAYVADRHRALSVESDVSAGLVGRDAVQELLADMLQQAFAPADRLVALPCRAAARRLLSVAEPSVIDGKMGLGNWYRGETGGLRKVGVYERAFSNRDLYCYDPVFDLSAMAADAELHGADALPGLLRDAFAGASGRPVDAERWLLYGVFHHAVGHQIARSQAAGGDGGEGGEARRRQRLLAGWMQGYLSSAYLGDIPRPRGGPVVAVPLEGVLERPWMGMWATGSEPARALRCLMGHGARVVVLSGRPLPDVRRACLALGLAGGVAENGTVVHDHLHGVDTEVKGDPAGWEPALRTLAGLLDGDRGAAPRFTVVGEKLSLRQAARGVAGHRPGGCRHCRWPTPRRREARVLAPVLDAVGAPPLRRLQAAALLWWRVLPAVAATAARVG